ncbi:MAG: globin domain-containing protein [Thermomonas sp.]|uniref:globin domain-containing protein n=1 Tax=Thermomonas sp. TaxID=1971895 RepID=UPI0039E44601
MNAMLKPTPTYTLLSPAEIELIQSQFARIGRDADGFAIDFYDALFSIAPLVRAMFRGPMPEQRAKLVKVLSMLVASLRNPAALDAPLAELGRRHRGYGVLALDYDKVGEALLQALGMRLGDAFDAGARAAWGKLYVHVASRMMAG